LQGFELALGDLIIIIIIYILLFYYEVVTSEAERSRTEGSIS